MLRHAVGLCVLLPAMSWGASGVYKCVERGHATYTDRPCPTGAEPVALPELIVTAPPARVERELARTHEQRLARERAERDRRDAEWLKQHNNRRDREARVRKAILERRVIKGMTIDEVRQALGEPDHVAAGDSYGTAKETWTYTHGGERRTVNFKDGEVTSTLSRRKGRR